MTIKYESELIKDIVDTRGHDKSSLHYESECIGAWIEETKGAYPKLCDYESEWLNYLNDNEIGKFPYEAVTANPTATVNNVVPYSYKNAILKGDTKYRDIDTRDILDTFDENKNLELVLVKMPVLMTTGKNLFDINNVIHHDGIIVNGNSILISENNEYPDNIIYTFENAPTESVLSFELSSNDVQNPGGALASVWYEDGTNIWITNTKKVYVNTKKIIDIRIHNWCKGTHIFSNIQLEKGTTATSYEPYKSNILTVNEPIELRGIDDVKDELNLMSGELTQRIGEVVLDGKINISWQVNNIDSNECIYFGIPNYGDIITSKRYSCDNFKFITGGINATFSVDTEFITNRFWTGDGYGLTFSIKKSKLESLDSNGFNNYLRNAPTTIHYHTKQESIKTVDLTVVNQDNETLSKIKPIEGTMNIKVTGNPVNPIGVFEVPVEAITQNLNSFIVEE